MNILILGDKYDKGKKSKGCQALIDFNTTTKYIEYQYKTLKDGSNINNIIYVYGLGDKKFISYYDNHKNLKRIKTIFNTHYDTKNETYSAYLCKDMIDARDSLLIIFGNTIIKKQHLQKVINANKSCVFRNSQNKSNIGCVHNNKNVENIGLDLDSRIDNIYYIAQADTYHFMEIIKNTSNHNRFIFEIINLMIDKDILVELL